MVWACFTAAGVGPIVVVDGNMGQDEYVNVLSNTMYPYLRQRAQSETDDWYVFQEDGSRAILVPMRPGGRGSIRCQSWTTGLHKVQT